LRVAEITDAGVRERLAAKGLTIDCGAAVVRIQSDVPELAAMLRLLYGAFQIEPDDVVTDASVMLRLARGSRRVFRPQIELWLDGNRPFERYPRDTPLPLVEWGVNFALAKRLHCYLLLHSGVVEMGGRAVVIPAMPGSGKSTLTVALSQRGFRLLSDEFGVVRLSDSRLLPLLRPAALKNESIDVISRFAPDAILGPRFPKTRKGTVAHLALDASTVDERHTPAQPAVVVFPRYDPTVEFELDSVPKARAFGRLAVNSFNYEVLGPDAFDALGRLVALSDCYELRYSDLDRAIDAITLFVRRADSATTLEEPAS